MTVWRIVASVLVIALIQVRTADGQQTTERYIPLGKSPGISASRSLIGEILDLDYDTYAMTVAAGKRTATVTMTPDTIYYVDRSHIKKTNATGSFEDCTVGQRVEVYLDDRGKVVWVKVRPDN